MRLQDFFVTLHRPIRNTLRGRTYLLPRLHGFELLMASYAVAHLKLDMLLQETGFVQPANQKRLKIYLTNSLEECHPDTGTLWSSWLSNEANEANRISVIVL